MKKLTRVERKMRRRRIFFRLLLLIFSISIMMIIALNTDIFVINNISLTGNNKLSREIVVNASNISKGENIFKVSLKHGKKGLMKLPYIKEARIKRDYPKTIAIELEERLATYQIERLSSFLIMDIEGFLLEIQEDGNEKLPLITGLELGNVNPGDNIYQEGNMELTKEFIDQGQALDLLKKIEEINLEDVEDIKINLIDGIPVAFGSPDNVRYKLTILDEILKDIEKKQISCKMIIMNRGENPIIEINDEEG